MSLEAVNVEERLHFLSELLSSQNKCCRWTYDADGKLLDTNCEDLILHTIFYNHDSFSYIMDYAQDHENPLILSRPIGLMWASAFQREDGKLKYFHVLGPVFVTEPTIAELEDSLRVGQSSLEWKRKVIRSLQTVQLCIRDSHLPSL